DAETFSVSRIERMLGIDVSSDPALLLGFGDDMESQRRLPGRFWPVDLGDSTASQPPDSQRQIKGDATRWDRLDLRPMSLAELHDGALAKLALDLANGEVYCAVTLCN